MLSLCFEPQPLLQKGSKASVCIHAKARGSFLLRYGDTIFGGTTFWVNFGRFAQNGHKLLLPVSAASPICSDFQTFCPDWLHFGHFLCFGGIVASQLSLRIRPIYF